jgi:hypothetical protein
MWRELNAKTDEDDTSGSVLAHTMGLGKTMQSITLLSTLNESVRSDIKRIRFQLPLRFRGHKIRHRHVRALVMCPSSLLTNWHREIQEWAGGLCGRIFVIESSAQAYRRVDEWVDSGGVLLIGYGVFKNIVLGINRKAKRKADTALPANAEDKAADTREVSPVYGAEDTPETEASDAVDPKRVRIAELLTEQTEIVVADEVTTPISQSCCV